MSCVQRLSSDSHTFLTHFFFFIYYLSFDAEVNSRRWNGKEETSCLGTMGFGILVVWKMLDQEQPR